MNRVQCIVQGPATTQPATINWRGGAIGNTNSLVDYVSSVTRAQAGGSVNVLTTVVLAVKAERLDLYDVPRRV